MAAIFRIDDVRFSGNKIDFAEKIGRGLHFDDSDEVFDEARQHPERFLPCGSEGSLEMSVWTNPDIHCIAAYTVSVFGDLRDHDSVDEIIAWFDAKCKSLEESVIIRQAVITVENERFGARTKAFAWGREVENEENNDAE